MASKKSLPELVSSLREINNQNDSISKYGAKFRINEQIVDFVTNNSGLSFWYEDERESEVFDVIEGWDDETDTSKTKTSETDTSKTKTSETKTSETKICKTDICESETSDVKMDDESSDESSDDLSDDSSDYDHDQHQFRKKKITKKMIKEQSHSFLRAGGNKILTEEELISNIAELINSGVFDFLKHLKTYSCIEKIILMFLSDCKIGILGGATGSGKTLGTIALYATLLEYDLESLSVVYISIPLIVGVKEIFKHVKEIMPEKYIKHIGTAYGGKKYYQQTQRLRLTTPGHIVGCIVRIVRQNNLEDQKKIFDKMVIVIDEAHTNSEENDLLVSICLYLQETTNLKMIFVSATVYAISRINKFIKYPTVELEGRLYQTTKIYLKEDPENERDLYEKTEFRILEYLLEGKNIMIFVAGEKDIIEMTKRLEMKNFSNLVIASLYSKLTQKEIEAALEPPPKGFRKVVFCTNMAESSVTVKYVTHVIDMGREFVIRNSPSGRGKKFVLEHISYASEIQREGRVGRASRGVCVKMWSLEKTLKMEKNKKTENMDPTLNVLKLLVMGLDATKILKLHYLQYEKIITKLHKLNLITLYADELPKPTNLGNRVLNFNSSLDVSIALAYLGENKDYTTIIIGLFILAFIEGGNGYLPFYTKLSDRDQLRAEGYNAFDVFREFKGMDDLETMFNILFGPCGMFTVNPVITHQIQSEWLKQNSMNSQLFSNIIWTFRNFYSVLYPKYSQIDPEFKCLQYLNPDIYEYGLKTSLVLDNIRHYISIPYYNNVEEYYPKVISRNKFSPNEWGFINQDNSPCFIDKVRSFSIDEDDIQHVFNLIPLNITETRGGNIYLSFLIRSPDKLYVEKIPEKTSYNKWCVKDQLENSDSEDYFNISYDTHDSEDFNDSDNSDDSDDSDNSDDFKACFNSDFMNDYQKFKKELRGGHFGKLDQLDEI